MFCFCGPPCTILRFPVLSSLLLFFPTSVVRVPVPPLVVCVPSGAGAVSGGFSHPSSPLLFFPVSVEVCGFVPLLVRALGTRGTEEVRVPAPTAFEVKSSWSHVPEPCSGGRRDGPSVGAESTARDSPRRRTSPVPFPDPSTLVP